MKHLLRPFTNGPARKALSSCLSFPEVKPDSYRSPLDEITVKSFSPANVHAALVNSKISKDLNTQLHYKEITGYWFGKGEVEKITRVVEDLTTKVAHAAHTTHSTYANAIHTQTHTHTLTRSLYRWHQLYSMEEVLGLLTLLTSLFLC